VPPRLRSYELLLDASQELLTLGHTQAQGGQIREVVRAGDPHDLRAAFVARGPDAYQLYDPGHVVSASPINEPESTLLDPHPQSRGGPPGGIGVTPPPSGRIGNSRPRTLASSSVNSTRQ